MRRPLPQQAPEARRGDSPGLERLNLELGGMPARDARLCAQAVAEGLADAQTGGRLTAARRDSLRLPPIAARPGESPARLGRRIAEALEQALADETPPGAKSTSGGRS